jgi:5-methylcytosine-specific restriction enzyme B
MDVETRSGPAPAHEYLPVARSSVRSASSLSDQPLEADTPLLKEVDELLEIYGGVIFTGPPGTGKSYWARRIGRTLSEGDEGRIVFLQFHPSYQYEDFVQGIVPMNDGMGFELVDKPFLQMARAATEDPGHLYVIVIDELSRADPGRVFGEALTYIEKSKRGVRFNTALDREAVQIPENLTIIGTMNPLDRGVDEVDAAFERRFAKIAMEPDRAIVEQFLGENGVEDPLRRQVLEFFDDVSQRAQRNPLAALGHTFFMNVKNRADLEKVWKHQLRFLFEKAYRLNPEEFQEIEERWQGLLHEEP